MDDGEVILGDGSYVFTLEKRGYVKAGEWTPQASCEHPAGVKQLGLEFAMAGADITQTFTFNATDDHLPEDCSFKCAEINQAAVNIAKSIVEEKGTILAGGVTQSEVYREGKRDKELVREELKRAFDVLADNKVGLIIIEYFHFIEEMEWAIEMALEYDLPVAATMCIGPQGDGDGVTAGECAVRMARAGAKILGVNCLFDPYITLETMALMKKSLDEEGLKPHLMCQPLGYRTPDAGRYGWIDIREFPYAVEPRQITRFEAAKYAREAYDLGVRYIGGCCGFEPYHIRAMAEELRVERKGEFPEASVKSDHDFSSYAKVDKLRPSPFGPKANREFWMDMHPSTGRLMSKPLCDQRCPQVFCRSAMR